MKLFISSLTNVSSEGEIQIGLTVSSSLVLSDYPIELKVYNTSGTNSGDTLYLGGKVRSDWGDIRILDASKNSIPFGITKTESSNIVLSFSADLINGNTLFYLKSGVPTTNIVKFGVTTDQHYDPTQTLVGRDKALTRLDNFATEMTSYLPNVILEGGDKIGATDLNSTNRMAYAQSVTDKHDNLATALGIQSYVNGFGNHDFDYTSFAQMLAQYGSRTGMVAGTLYGSWSDDNFTYISLDSNYIPGTQNHQSNTHVGYGYINTDQLTWLTGVLSAATKRCIVMVHHGLAEMDTDKITLTKEIYHVQNRADVRDILEASGKVVCVLHGHLHLAATNVINNIPYFGIQDLNEPNTNVTDTWNTPYTGGVEGSWAKLEIDLSSLSIRYIQEVYVGAAVETIYDYTVPFKTIYDTDYGDSMEKVFEFGNLAEYEKASCISDATDIYVNDYNYIITKPPCVYDNDAKLSDKTIKILGRTVVPDYGRGYWNFAPQTGLFSFKFDAQLETLAGQRFKIEEKSSGKIATYISFVSDGNINGNNSTSFSSIGTYSVDTWYNFDLQINLATEKYDCFLDGVQVVTQNDFYSTGISQIDQLQLTVDPANFFINNVRIEQLTSSPPVLI